MTSTPPSGHSSDRSILGVIARRVMVERGLQPDEPPAAVAQLRAISGAAPAPAGMLDLSALLWCSIDNDDSRDLDQLSVAEKLPEGAVRIRVAVADVDAVVERGTPLDDHAQANTTSVYTAGGIFPMLPERLSTDLTSLNAEQDRVALVMDYVVLADGKLGEERLYRAKVRNQAKLAYDSVAAWLDGQGPMPVPVAKVPGMEEQVRVQDAVAAKLKACRHEAGALDLETVQSRAVLDDDSVVGLALDKRNRARSLIEEFMVAANGVTARFLKARQVPSMRRVVRSPERWEKIVAYARRYGADLPAQPDSGALEKFLASRRQADPLRFPDVSLDIVKLMGRGEYVVEMPGEAPIGHFGLAVRDYSHSTAPNRRFPDLIAHRLVKAALGDRPRGYERSDLEALARHCTEQEDHADRVERQVRKSAAALFLRKRVGAHFEAIAVGVSEKGTWVRTIDPPVEGKLVHGAGHLAVGDRLRVKLTSVDVEKGFIDFVRE